MKNSFFFTPKDLWEMKGLRNTLLVFYFLCVISIWSYTPIISLILLIVPIWLIPEEKTASTWRERLKAWKEHRVRVGLSILVAFLTLINVSANMQVKHDAQIATDSTPVIIFKTESGHIGDLESYPVSFTVTNAESITVNGDTIPITASGEYTVDVTLRTRKTSVSVSAVNGEFEARETILLERNKNETELAADEAREQQERAEQELANQVSVIEENDISYAGCKRIGVRVTVPDDAPQDLLDIVLDDYLDRYLYDDVTIWAWNESEIAQISYTTATRGTYERSSCR